MYLHVSAHWQVETRHIDLSMYGAPHGFTAMAQTVGKPAAIASKMILTGKFHNGLLS